MRVRAFRAAAGENRLSLIAAAVAFYSFLSVFPGLAAVVSIYGLVSDPATLDRHMRVLPDQAAQIIRGQLAHIVSGPRHGPGLGLVLGLGAALWSAQRGVSALCRALNIVYGVKERRGYLRRAAVSLPLTVAAILLVVVTLAVVAGLPNLIERLAGPGSTTWHWLRALLGWPTLAGAMLLGLAVVFRWGAHRPQARWHWITWGSALATACWLLVSWGFSFYLAHFGSFDRTYGSMAAIAILLTWIYLTAFVVLLGAQLDAFRASAP
jgi:membrane protein